MDLILSLLFVVSTSAMVFCRLSASTMSLTHALTALWATIMMNIGLMGIIYRAERRFMLIEPDSLLMIVVYVLGLWLLFNG